MARALVALSDALDRLCRRAASFGIVLMLTLIAIQVVARYVLSSPPAWTEEGARYAMVWAGFLGAAVAYRQRLDPTLVALAVFETGALRALGGALRAVATLIFLAPIWWYSFFGPNGDPMRGYLARSSGRSTEALGIPMIWFAAALPVAITVIFVHVGAALAARPKPEDLSGG